MVHYWWAFCCILARCCGTPRGGGGGGCDCYSAPIGHATARRETEPPHPPLPQKTRRFAAIWHSPRVPETPPVHRHHPRQQRWTLCVSFSFFSLLVCARFCANRLRSTFSQHCTSQCAKNECQYEECVWGGHAFSLLPSHWAIAKWCNVITLRALFLSITPTGTGASMSPSHPRAAPLCASFDSHFDTPHLYQFHIWPRLNVKSRLIVHVFF